MKGPRADLTVAAAATALLLAGAVWAAPAVNVTGRYTVRDVDHQPAGVSLTFTADLLNEADTPVSGRVVLRDPALTDRVFATFGEVSIAPGESKRVSAVDVQVPESIFRSWSQEGAPGLYVDVENEEGDVTLFRVPLSRALDG
jgi:hypothetical protein